MPRRDGAAHGSKMRISIGGVIIARDDPRLPDAIRGMIDDQDISAVRTQQVYDEMSLSRTDPAQFSELLKAMEPLLHDLAVTQALLPDVEDRSWDEDPDVISAFIGRGHLDQGIRIRLSLPSAARMVDLASQVQEWEIEELWAAGKNVSWPNCPIHPNSHPLSPRASDDDPKWCCPVTDKAICAIGSLAAPA